jgi:hypothetical protein
MPDAATDARSGEGAEQALAYLAEMSPDLRGAVILDSAGDVLAATGSTDRWGEGGLALLGVADDAGGEPVQQLHIATEQGEVFAVRSEGMAAIAVTERFALASLMLFDLRSILRDLTPGRGRRAA